MAVYTAASPFTVGNITKKTDVDITHANTVYLNDAAASGDTDIKVVSNKYQVDRIKSYSANWDGTHAASIAATTDVVVAYHGVSVPIGKQLRVTHVRGYMDDVSAGGFIVPKILDVDSTNAHTCTVAVNPSASVIDQSGLTTVLFDNSGGGSESFRRLQIILRNTDSSSDSLTPTNWNIWVEFSLYA